MDRFDAILAAMPGTRRDIQAKLGITKGALQNLLVKLHKAGWCHVAGWERLNVCGPGKFLRRFKAGPGKDKPCKLVPLTQQERDERRYCRGMKTGDIEERRAKNRMRHHERRAKKKQNTWLGPLGL